jgi:RimJ/RimL family protein N-acetyltransferase
MSYFKKLIGKKCYLAPCSVADAEKWTQWDNDLEVTIPLGDEAYEPMPLDNERESIAGALAHKSHLFDIVESENDTLIGRCMLFSVNHIDRTAMLGICIGEKAYWSKGYGQEAISLLLDYAFNLLNLNNVMLGTFAFNERAIRCYKKVGFKEIGRRRQGRIIAGQAYDCVLMDILAAEYKSVYVKGLIDQYAPEKPKQWV